MVGFTPESVAIAVRRALGRATSWHDHHFELVDAGPHDVDRARHVRGRELVPARRLGLEDDLEAALEVEALAQRLVNRRAGDARAVDGLVVALALVGLLLILFELHVLPGHGIAGGLGALILVASVLLLRTKRDYLVNCAFSNMSLDAWMSCEIIWRQSFRVR